MTIYFIFIKNDVGPSKSMARRLVREFPGDASAHIFFFARSLVYQASSRGRFRDCDIVTSLIRKKKKNVLFFSVPSN